MFLAGYNKVVIIVSHHHHHHRPRHQHRYHLHYHNSIIDIVLKIETLAYQVQLN